MQEINFQSLTRTIIEYLRIHIVEGVLYPGQKLNEEEISRSLGISRPPLREAFRVLEGEDLVVNIARKGCYVKAVDKETCQEIFRLREMMECYAIELIEEKKIEKFGRIEATLQRKITLPVISDPFDKYRYLKQIADFHIQLIESANNSRLKQFYLNSFPALARYQSMYTYINGLMDESHKTHAEILDLLKNKQYEEAKNKVRLHIRGFLTILDNHLNNGLLLSQQREYQNAK